MKKEIFVEKRSKDNAKTITIAQVKGIKVRELFLNEKKFDEMKFGRRKNDRFICINGILEILDLNNNTSSVLEAGDSCEIASDINQSVKSYDGNICNFMIIQND